MDAAAPGLFGSRKVSSDKPSRLIESFDRRLLRMWWLASYLVNRSPTGPARKTLYVNASSIATDWVAAR